MRVPFAGSRSCVHLPSIDQAASRLIGVNELSLFGAKAEHEITPKHFDKHV